ncbi:membrane-associated progesterone-binding protein 4 [Phalaenopsis equestris]|uniref:membrane-associated progesterone-binding protein 4 n=1 Tax=Phalaenopsis equestris TaxID=78828 RepID=UPI0009E239EE|nr:membrane-associated progesterone-binding protein 4 [Phalaenopsis equestris]
MKIFAKIREDDSREAKNLSTSYDQSQLASHREEEMHRRMELTRRLFPSLIGSAFIVAMAAVLLLRFTSIRKPDQPRMWTVEEIAPFNGTDDKLSILLGILGSVFDVTKGRSHYGPGGGYHHFAGRDASRAFVSGNFTGDGLTDSLQGLSGAEMSSVVDWRKFYFERYTFVGKLVGRYYDKDGSPTKHLKGVEAKAKRAARLQEKQKIEEAKIPSCNSKWSQQEGGEVWCDVGYPRLVQRPLEIARTGKMSRRCACFKEEDLGRPGLELYNNCDFLSKSCVV